MKKRLYLITTILLSAAALSLSSCLKDSRYVDLTKVGSIIEFPFGGQVYFGSPYEALTGADTIVTKFAVNVASPTVPTTSTAVTFDVDNPATVAAYNAAHKGVIYLAMPANAYVFTQNSVTIAAGRRDTAMTVTIYANLLDPSKSYMLPISIKTAGGINISGNQGTMYFHLIGNVFAGAYRQTFRRFNAADSTSVAPNGASFSNQPVTISPVSPTEFVVYSGYAGTVYHYDVTFTDNGNGTYSNFTVSFPTADIASGTASGITVDSGPFFLSTGANTLPGTYTVPQAQALFDFQFNAHTSAPRYLVDYYYK